MLDELIELLDNHLSSETVKPLGQIGVFHCRQPQKLHAVPIHQPSIVLVLKGTKRIAFSSRSERFDVGDLALLPAGSELLMENIPCSRQQEYLALCLGFAPATVERFLASYGSHLDWSEQRDVLMAKAPQSFTHIIKQRVNWCMEGDQDNQILNDLQQQEILSVCGYHNLLGLLLQLKHPSWRQRVSGIISLDLSSKWKFGDVCRKLNVSESGLRRNLQAEGTSFSDLLEQARLVAGLALLQETSQPVSQVAAAVGYQSQSRFTERFKQRFGITPSQLKQSREPLSQVELKVLDGVG